RQDGFQRESLQFLAHGFILLVKVGRHDSAINPLARPLPQGISLAPDQLANSPAIYIETFVSAGEANDARSHLQGRSHQPRR
ncbi:MAG: hypothetical protein RSF79_17975, partial [Janthinobacterium sp.]